MPCYKTMKSAATKMCSEAQTQGEKVFGRGYSFRKNHVFGNQEHDTPQVNLCTVWKDTKEDDIVHGPGRVHKTWQEVMLNKRKRRPFFGIAALVILALATIVATRFWLDKQTMGGMCVCPLYRFFSRL
jgi:hypothetical protein